MLLQPTNLLRKCILSTTTRLFSVTSANAKSFRKWYRELWTPKAVITPPYAHFTQIGDPVLRTKAAPVPDDCLESKETKLIVKQMVKVLRSYDCVGIAAPQLGVSLRIIVMEFRAGLADRYTKREYEARKMCTLPLTVFINPVMKVTNYEMHKFSEACMSVRSYSADVERYHAVSLSGFNEHGMAQELQLEGWNARIAQHEMDHLEGKIYIDKMDPSTFTCTCWEAVNAHGGRIELPFYK